jgi:hypothetical protein
MDPTSTGASGTFRSNASTTGPSSTGTVQTPNVCVDPAHRWVLVTPPASTTSFVAGPTSTLDRLLLDTGVRVRRHWSAT